MLPRTQVLGPEEMILVPPRHYCIIKNPVKRDAESKLVVNDDNQV
jgi:major vault protein